ncbi:unnamed protein product [Leptosia nina]|uniref:RHD domain-containing protein n=1 Tax=Leptosia nina TaxID=320188 RepID=A0AAV1IXG7_9NEOP
MDNGGEGVLENIIHNDGEPPTHLNISDVIEAITKADPVYAGVDAMSRPPASLGAQPYVRIVEQPASKALRFRYECEGRSAGSIPGVTSTPEKKTYPTIEICGHRGPAIIVVSCVTRDEPFKAHPHNLVGRDRCDKGVCTVKTNLAEDNRISFSNLGIQCVKRKDIAEALSTREKLRVDPFKTGYSHRNQPQTIDLNAVRLCFQVFIPDERTGKIRHSLAPVVSDIIFDKKAMSDLVIMRLSHCSAPPQGGLEMFLLCEKVVREDVAVVFFQKDGDMIVWEENANILLVHKQYAIAFNVPPYRNQTSSHHVQVYIQLKRISDNARSNPVPFEYIPDFQGIPAARKPLPDLAAIAALLHKPDGNNNTNTQDTNTHTEHTDSPQVTSTSDVIDDVSGIENGIGDVENIDIDDGDVIDCDIDEPHTNGVLDNERSLNDLLEQVAELDEIYSENRTRLENITIVNDAEDVDVDVDDFNDAGTYTSLQLAFKNPVTIAEPEPYEDVQVQTFRGPIIEFTPLKGGDDDERAPPLPPKRVRKNSDAFKTSQTSVNSILKPGRKLPVTRNPDMLSPRGELTVAKSEPALPPPPKKRSFFSRLFRRKEKSPAPSVKSEGQKEVKSKPVGRSVSSVSGIRPSKFKSAVSHTSLKDNASATGLSYADSVTHISLHEDMDDKSSQRSLKRPASLAPLPPTDGGTILVAESVLALDASAFKKLQDDLDLTEAEHYALYMAVAPHATASEFDETSCYYSPVDGNSSYLKHKRQKTLNPLHQYDDRNYADQQIKSEPRDKTPPHQMNSPQYAVQENYQHWNIQNIPNVLEPNMMAGSYQQEMQWGQNYVQLSPSEPSMSPNMMSPMHVGAAMSPVGRVSPMSHTSMGQVMTPMGKISPMHGAISPNMVQMAPIGHVSPNPGHMAQNIVQPQQQLPQQDLMDGVSDTPSLSVLLDERGELGQFNSGDLSGLVSMLGRGQDLSDSLNRLSTNELYRA